MVVIVTDGSGSHPSSQSYPSARLGDLREHEALQAVTVLGLSAERLHFLRLRDTATPQSGPEFDATVQHYCRSDAGQRMSEPSAQLGSTIRIVITRLRK